MAAGLFWATTGLASTGSFLAGLVGSVLFLLLSYSLLFLAISALSRSLGTALLVSVLFFLLFAFFWSVITLLLAGLAGPTGSVAWFQAEVALSLFSPTGVYMQFLSQSLRTGNRFRRGVLRDKFLAAGLLGSVSSHRLDSSPTDALPLDNQVQGLGSMRAYPMERVFPTFPKEKRGEGGSLQTRLQTHGLW